MNSKTLKEITNKFLEKNLILHLGTFDKQGAWVCALEYVNDSSNNIYWRSDELSRHSKAIAKNSQVSVAVTSPIKNADAGLQMTGRVSVIKSAQLRNSLTISLERKRSKKISNRIKTIEMNRVWYKFTPTYTRILNTKLAYESIEYKTRSKN